MTFRMRGHEEASGTKYVPQEKFDQWSVKDPVQNYEQFLISEKLLTNELIEEIKAQIKADINSALDTAFAEQEICSSTEQELADMYKILILRNSHQSEQHQHTYGRRHI